MNQVEYHGRSILWLDSTLENDKILVEYLVDKIVAGKDFGNHHSQCVSKIMRNIQTEAWQAKYSNPATFVFSIYHALRLKTDVEIGFLLFAQAMELLYFHESQQAFNPDAPFYEKLMFVFHKTYEWEMPEDVARGIGILRNDVAHTGTIAGVTGAYRNENHPNFLITLFEEYEFDKNQLHTNVQNRIFLMSRFEYLMQDVLMRVMGLDQNDLAFNGAPPWNSALFGYDHENRPDWLRE